MTSPKTFMNYVEDAKSRITEVDIETAEQLMAEGHKVLDIREPHEYVVSRIRDSINVPRGVLEPAADLEFAGANPALRDAREDNWLIICATGGRAALAADTLQAMGFKSVTNIAGGLTAWEGANKEVHRETETTFE